MDMLIISFTLWYSIIIMTLIQNEQTGMYLTQISVLLNRTLYTSYSKVNEVKEVCASRIPKKN